MVRPGLNESKTTIAHELSVERVDVGDWIEMNLNTDSSRIDTSNGSRLQSVIGIIVDPVGVESDWSEFVLVGTYAFI